MKKALLGVLAILAMVAIAWAGGDPWKSKPYSQWDEKDVMAVLQTSPWSKVGVTAQGAWRPEGAAAADTANLGVAGSASDRSAVTSGASTSQMGGTEKRVAAIAAQQPYNIFWWSSRTIREASARRAVLKGTITQADADKMVSAPIDSYQILVSAQNMYIFEQRGEEAFKSAAFLQLHRAKEKLSPTKVEFQKSADGKVVGAVFNFAKTNPKGEPAISPDEKQIDFELEIGGTWLRTYFTPKQMADNKGEDL